MTSGLAGLSGEGNDKAGKPRDVVIDGSRHPESADHARDAQSEGHSKTEPFAQVEHAGVRAPVAGRYRERLVEEGDLVEVEGVGDGGEEPRRARGPKRLPAVVEPVAAG